MKKIIFIIALVSFYILVFDSCKKKCESDNLGNVSFSATDLQIVPYKGTETLIFKDSLGDTLMYKGTGRISNYNQIWNQFPNDEECMGDYFYTETNTTPFLGNGDIYIDDELSMSGGNPFHQNFNKFISITVSYGGQYSWWFEQSFCFNAMKLTQPVNIAQSTLSFNDSLKIGPKKFYSVYVLEQLPSYPLSGVENLQYVYYTINEGVVGFKEQTGKRWYLSN